MGYWLVMAMVGIALGTVLVTCWEEPHGRSSAGRRPWVVLAASDGTGHGLDESETSAWPAILAQSLPPTSYEILNLSIGGMTLDRAVVELLPEAISASPARVSLWLVVNDYGYGRLLEDYARDLDVMLAALNATGATVWVGNLPDLSTLPFLAEASGDPIGLRAECQRWNEAIAEIAARHGAHVVDFFADPIDPVTIGEDGFHPSLEGQIRLAERFRLAASNA